MATGPVDDGPQAVAEPAYEPPAVADLGTLAELTQGGMSTDVDGSGGAAGSAGSL